MKSIHTLVDDIYALVQTEDWFHESLVQSLSTDIAVRIQGSFKRNSTPGALLRLSKMGPECPRALWYSAHHKELAETLPPWAQIKFTYGHILEGLVIALAREAGHTVQGEQDELLLDDVPGHRDCVIDGCTVDVKSCSSRMFEKFKRKTIHQDDVFGYLDQIDGYVVAAADDPIVTVKDKGYILAIDKTLGHIILYEHTVREHDIKSRIRKYKDIVALSSPPSCECRVQPKGMSGNIGLDTKASYSPYKHLCFPQLRTFVYANGPVFLTKVVRKPDVPELKRERLHIPAMRMHVQTGRLSVSAEEQDKNITDIQTGFHSAQPVLQL